MAGHSKWNNIKQRKGAMDAKKGKVFSQISKQIKMATKEGGSGDPASNPSLRLALEKARSANMPKDNIQRAIDRGLGKSSTGAVIHQVNYEGFGPGGVPVVVSAMTDNPNRTSSNLKFIFSRNGGSIGSPGSALYMFQRNEEGDYVTTMPMPLEESEEKKIVALIDQLLSDDDVEDVYTAAQLSEDD
ncbi:MAG: YebC/PmpR family DNA-binding transcriptional regulator [Microgenomates group bacterium]